jgi:hypothetical protein
VRLVDGASIWSLKATHGLPLDFALGRLAQAGLVPTWDRLIEAARRDAVNISKLIRELQFFVREAYSPDDAAVICARLPLLVNYGG